MTINKNSTVFIHEKIKELIERVKKLETEKVTLTEEIQQLQSLLEEEKQNEEVFTTSFTPREKLAIFMNLFRGREDVFPKRWDNQKTGKSGYSPACQNEWVREVCKKPQIKCSECPNQAFIPVSGEVIRNHLSQPASTMGVYPMLKDETCWFLAVDFDKENWKRDAAAFLETCRLRNVPVSIERSRSGNGGHVWIFFSEPIAASDARKLGSALLTETMRRCPEIGFESYDRLFPNQDTMHGKRIEYLHNIKAGFTD
jgi:hypothetical protein